LTPVAGMRRSDAEAFSKWLGARDGAFFFRLPHFGELSVFGLEEEMKAIQDGIVEGYWTDSDSQESIRFNRVVSGEPIPLAQVREIMVNRARVRSLDLGRTLDLDRALARTHGRYRNFDRILDHARGAALASALDRALDRVLPLPSILDRSFISQTYSLVALTILKARIQGKLPAIEGIRLVKERRA